MGATFMKLGRAPTTLMTLSMNATSDQWSAGVAWVRDAKG
jgi:hypothetical protein